MVATLSLQAPNEVPPRDEETVALFNPEPEDPIAEINSYILSHPLTKSLNANEKFHASRPHLKIPLSLRPHHFTGGTLLGGDKIPVPPLIFATQDGTALISLQYLGTALSGHPGIAHAGVLATLLDECLAHCCFPALPNKTGVTASLKIDFRKPCQLGQYVVIKAQTTKVEGRKAWVSGRMETLPKDREGEVLVDAEALCIGTEPRSKR